MAKTIVKRDEVLRNMLKTPPKRHESLGVRGAHENTADTKDTPDTTKPKLDKPTEQKNSVANIFVWSALLSSAGNALRAA